MRLMLTLIVLRYKKNIRNKKKLKKMNLNNYVCSNTRRKEEKRKKELLKNEPMIAGSLIAKHIPSVLD